MNAEQIYVFDSDGGRAIDEPQENLDTAIRAAAKLVVDTWPDWSRATITSVINDEVHVPLAIVQRMGPKGSRRVRCSLAGAEWVSVEWTLG